MALFEGVQVFRNVCLDWQAGPNGTSQLIEERRLFLIRLAYLASGREAEGGSLRTGPLGELGMYSSLPQKTLPGSYAEININSI